MFRTFRSFLTTGGQHYRLLLTQAGRQVATHSLYKPAGLAVLVAGSGFVGYTVHAALYSRPPSNISLSTFYGSPEDFRSAIAALRTEFGAASDEMVSTDEADLQAHSSTSHYYTQSGASIQNSYDAIVYPHSTEDVVKIVKIATKYRMPISPYGAATSIEGHTHANQHGGICIDFRHMDHVLAIHADDSDIVCQAGARWTDVNEMLASQGIPLFCPLDPGPGATFGGMVSTGCSGTNAMRYGTAKGEWFLNVTVVLPSGEVIKTRRRSRKSAAGFDMTKLFIGAEGTLGIVTEVTVRLAPVLPTTVAVVHFPDVKKATEAVIDAMNQGVGIQCAELMDSLYMRATNLFGISHRNWLEKDSIFFKFQGSSQEALDHTARVVRAAVERHGGTDFYLATSEQEAHDIWSDRKNALFLGMSLVPGAKGWSTDVCVPISNLPRLIMETKDDLSQLGLVCPVIGHVGDGNFHALFLFKTEEEEKIVHDAMHRVAERAIALDGTCTGEHGVGIGKKDYLVEELGQSTVDLMKLIKKTIDPLNLFNPGKLYPDDAAKSARAKDK
ncbi:hypothetical protein FISHEDRAFT_72171 [Fistulina hepatica ATCC 64428]|uniref:D-lactate dehydrogenase (cytochrome) n=1 Tax=Fistulina hepatica ATCC 64428 TaxID=1128425 RepID=A0A0D7AF32_9AGAR|nr:hypothetical protein FISHEDRAFT_72171 [Fistulina hepatica ATCC 64428]